MIVPKNRMANGQGVFAPPVDPIGEGRFEKFWIAQSGSYAMLDVGFMHRLLRVKGKDSCD